MKQLITCGILLMLISCTPKPETIELSLSKSIDISDFHHMSGAMSQKDGRPVSAIYPELKNLPADWKGIKCYYNIPDFPQALYQSFREGKISEEDCMYYFKAWGMDTAAYSVNPVRAFIPMITGVAANGDTCFMIDSNGDCDFVNEKPQFLNDPKAVTEVTFDRYCNGIVVTDTTYVIPLPTSQMMFLKFVDVAKADFKVKNKEYTCSVYSNCGDYSNLSAEICFSDSLTTLKCKVKQFVKLADTYYTIDSVGVDGKFIKLVEYPDAENQAALQKDFRPYAFTATTIEGKKINFPDDFKGKYVLLDFWSASCSPCREEIKDWLPLIYHNYKEKGLEIVGIADNTSEEIEDFMKTYPINWPQVADRDCGQAIQQLYKVNYWPSVYLIGKDGKIIAIDGDARAENLYDRLAEIFPEVPTFQTYDPETFNELLQKDSSIQLVDVRHLEEYAAGHIGEAVNIDVWVDGFHQKADSLLDKSRPVAVYCKTGIRSKQAAYQLINKGYTLYNLKGGYEGWNK
ncbi:rhodanese-like domain-containing protein [Parabacteroides provencensis]|uniref:rhodanese-like domain-containing protein n=1 Tax=Parabacteroides provencensis TaxID=1944636 RepID=UPI000C15B2BA|nr:rhodanese-like domain-containing protein [Parabacteroides provencensis]